MPADERRWRRAPRLAVVRAAGRVAAVRLIDPGLPPIILEGSAAVIWDALSEERSVDALVRELATEFDVPEQVKPEVDAFLNRLEREQLVCRAG